MNARNRTRGNGLKAKMMLVWNNGIDESKADPRMVIQGNNNKYPVTVIDQDDESAFQYDEDYRVYKFDNCKEIPKDYDDHSQDYDGSDPFYNGSW